MFHEIPCQGSVFRMQPMGKQLCIIHSYRRNFILVIQVPGGVFILVVQKDVYDFIRIKPDEWIGCEIKVK